MSGQESATGPDEPMVEWKFPPQTEVRKLIDFVANELDFGVLYDDRINDARITMRTRSAVPKTSLLALLETALRMRDLALVDAEIPGWKRVVGVDQLVTSTPINDDESTEVRRPSSPITEIIRLEYLDAITAATDLRSFLTNSNNSTANTNPLNDPQMLILMDANAVVITDFADNLDRIKKLISWLDVKPGDETIKFVQLKHANTKAVADELANLVLGGKKRDTRAPRGGSQGRDERIVQDDRSQQLILIGSQREVEKLAEVAEKLDIADNAKIRSYKLQFAAVEPFHELLQTLFDDGEANSVKTSIAPDGEAILVRANPLQHNQIAAIVKQIDVEKPQDQSRVRFYHLDHTTALEILTTMRALESDGGQRGAAGVGGSFPGIPASGFNSGFGPGYSPYQSQMGGTSTFPSNIRSRSNSRLNR